MAELQTLSEPNMPSFLAPAINGDAIGALPPPPPREDIVSPARRNPLYPLHGSDHTGEQDDNDEDDDGSSTLSDDDRGRFSRPYPSFPPSIGPKHTRKILAAGPRLAVTNDRRQSPISVPSPPVDLFSQPPPPPHRSFAPPPPPPPPPPPRSRPSFNHPPLLDDGYQPEQSELDVRHGNTGPWPRDPRAPPKTSQYNLSEHPADPSSHDADSAYTSENDDIIDDDSTDSSHRSRWFRDAGNPALRSYRDLQDVQEKMTEIFRSIDYELARKDEITMSRDALENDLDYGFRLHELGSTRRGADLAPRFRDLQQVRSQLRDVEGKIKLMMTELRDVHCEAETLQAAFLSHYVQEVAAEESPPETPRPSTTPAPTTPAAASFNQSVVSGISAELPEKPMDPLYEELVRAVEDLHLAQESQDNLALQKEIFDEEQEKRRIVSNVVGAPKEPLNPAEAKVLEDFEIRRQNAAVDVSKWRAQVDTLFQQCKDKGVMPDDPPFFDDNGYNLNVDSVCLPGPSPQHTLDHYNFPGLVSSPMHVLANPFPLTAQEALKDANELVKTHPNRYSQEMLGRRKKECLINSPFTPIGGDASKKTTIPKLEFLNRWLLHKLRVTPMEAWVCFNVFQSFVKIKNTGRWESDVMGFWLRDDAAESSHFQQSVDSDGLIVDNSTILPLSRAMTSTLGELGKPTSVVRGPDDWQTTV